MSVESKIKFRVYAFSVGAFIIVAFLLGVVRALVIALLVFLLWKTYSYVKLMRWWKGESPTTRQIIEFVTQRLNEGANSKNFWVTTMTNSDVTQIAKDYRVELMARPMVIEKTSSDLIEGWTEWGSTRLEDCVLRHSSEELADNIGSDERPIPMLKLMIAKTALEITVTEYALTTLGVTNPRQVLSQRMVSKQLEEKNSDTDLAWAFKSERTATALDLLAKELGEATRERA